MNNAKVLMIADDQNLLNYVKKSLSGEPYEVLTAASFAQASCILEKQNIRVLISDQKISGSSIEEFVRKVNSKSPQILHVIMTEFIDEQQLFNLVKTEEIYTFLTKPLQGLNVKTTIRHALKRVMLEEENRSLKEKLEQLKASGAQEGPDQEPMQPDQSNRKTILIVDDETNFVKLLKLQLKVKNYLVVTASDGQVALQKLEVINPDLIILDINMPTMNGIEFYKNIQTRYGKAKYPVYILTSRGTLEGTFMEMDIVGFKEKPFLVDDLLSDIDGILRGQKDRNVYFIDDQKNNHIGTIQELLEKERYKVQIAPDPQQIKSGNETQRPHVIFWEYSQIAGKEKLLNKVKENFPGVPVVLYSFNADINFGRDCLKAGADGYLGNPQGYDEFVIKIRELELKRK